MIEIVDYRSAWADEFVAVAASLGKALGDRALSIDHIGSTAVPGLCGKDVLDIQVTVQDLRESEAIVRSIAKLGFEHRPAVTRDHVPPSCDSSEELWTKLFFRSPPGERRINVHVRQIGRPNQRYALLFRDFLIAAAPYAEAYGELKRRLAATLADANAYADVKDPAVDLIYFAAEEWASRTGWRAPTARTEASA